MSADLRRRLIVALPLAIVLLAAGVVIGLVGLAAGVMAGDGCSPGTPPDWVSLWLTILWPLSILVVAILPPLLIVLGCSYKAAAIVFAISAAVSVGVWLLWLPILASYC